MKKIPSLIFCGLSLATAATWAHGQGALLPIPTLAPPSSAPSPAQNAASKDSRAQIEYLRRAAGLTALRGPGVIVTLRDRKGASIQDASKPIPGLVHDYDLHSIVNQLRAAEAEAISVNGVRVGSQTAITVVGSSIIVGGQRLNNPFKVEAIGDATLLKKRLAASGIAGEFKNVGPYISVATSKNVRVPALKEAPAFRFGKPE